MVILQCRDSNGPDGDDLDEDVFGEGGKSTFVNDDAWTSVDLGKSGEILCCIARKP